MLACPVQLGKHCLLGLAVGPTTSRTLQQPAVHDFSLFSHLSCVSLQAHHGVAGFDAGELQQVLLLLLVCCLLSCCRGYR
jgi:hypothetical protein